MVLLVVVLVVVMVVVVRGPVRWQGRQGRAGT